MRDHGGNIDGAIARFGGADWIDLSTGINRVPYPIPSLQPEDWTMLPTRSAKQALLDVAARAYRTQAPMLAVAGAQAAIQMIPLISPRGNARVLGPTYNEHAASLRAAGWKVEQVSQFGQLAGADLAVVVNPNNPDGRFYASSDLQELAGKVGRLVVDESFADAQPGLSVAPHAGMPGLLVLRSFGKFYGLAGVRLGFVIGPAADIAALEEISGPWPVNGAALRIGAAALADTAWAEATIQRLRAEMDQADALAKAAGWALVGGCELFRTYDTPDAETAQNRLAERQIWSRIFPYSNRWLRLGLPGSAREWARLAQAMVA
ncbi:MAG: cobalamin biosynthetic protein CobC [Rhodobacteraceae bacterium]|uniref:threonine-phosphate decarboxylase CobD n=1 Tax=Cypionkella sp. TaxID=2811411 RepID=UPI00132821C9|nr:threonine-phosphate decarboxylase CobD [Cypionkella sp.]KAF0174402.1 MAG: cobalamin biosynthetic protein CobC [Paracoccaceae bacterium]MDO8326551.1 threonine-phosphate decarboxylase CobD [Cypionkella sp.]